mgnify:CR=1 FL=1
MASTEVVAETATQTKTKNQTGDRTPALEFELDELLVLAQNLSLLLGTDQVLVYPCDDPLRPDYQIRIEVRRFDGGPDAEPEGMRADVLIDRSPGNRTEHERG